MKNKISLCLLICFGSYQMTPAQTITKISSSPVTGTVCPVQGIQYEVSSPGDLGSCLINWTATNGDVFKDINDQRKVTVNWSDTPGAKGKLTATFVNCKNEADDNTTASMEELILSVKDQAWDTYDNSVNVDYCTWFN